MKPKRYTLWLFPHQIEKLKQNAPNGKVSEYLRKIIDKLRV
jgi:hypothetical protein